MTRSICVAALICAMGLTLTLTLAGCSGSDSVDIDGGKGEEDSGKGSDLSQQQQDKGSAPDVQNDDLPSPDKDKDTSSGPDAQTFCTAMAQMNERCGRQTPAAVVECGPTIQGVIGRFRSEAIAAYIECSATVDCDAGDECFAAMAEAVTPDPLNDPIYLQCQSKRAGCQTASEPTFSDDICVVILLLVDTFRDMIKECYERPCAEMKGCVESLVEFDLQ